MESLVKLNPGLMIWTWLTFGLMLVILAWKGWGPMIRALERREQRIREALEGAEKAREETERLAAEHQEEVTRRRQEAQQILAEAREAADKMRAEMETIARDKASEIIVKAEEQITAERQRALREIRTTVVDLSLEIAGKVIERNLSTKDNQKLVEDTLRQIGKA
jgi:F-type H+-transporting ATPase subunit b